MAEVIFLSDSSVNLLLGGSRYMGPYVLASQLEKSGFDTVVIDYFTTIPCFFEYLEKFIEPSTLFIGISSTFLSRSLGSEQFDWVKNNESNLNFLLQQNTNRSVWDEPYRAPGFWLSSLEKFEDWMKTLRALLNRYNCNAKIILGGAKANGFFRDQASFSGFDYLAISASDLSIVEFAKSLKAGETPKYFEQNGSRVIDNREELKNKICPETILTSNYGILQGESLPIEVSRGCIFNCKFCHYDKKESFRKPLDILKREFTRNYEQFGTTVYSFCDDCFNDSRGKVEEICNMILGLPFKIEWVAYARVDVAVRFPETLALMVESGAKGLFLGLESFEPLVARNSGKGTPIDKVKEFLIDAYSKFSSQCLFEGSFVVGLPGETHESQRKTINWIKENRVLDFLSLGALTILPYDQKLDKVAIDYADYSRRPELHGFKSVKYESTSTTWEHETMNSTEAMLLVEEFNNVWANQGHRTLLRSIWNYPTMRSLGYTQADIHDMARNETNSLKWCYDVFERRHKHTHQYWNQLLAVHDKSKSKLKS